MPLLIGERLLCFFDFDVRRSGQNTVSVRHGASDHAIAMSEIGQFDGCFEFTVGHHGRLLQAHQISCLIVRDLILAHFSRR